MELRAYPRQTDSGETVEVVVLRLKRYYGNERGYLREKNLLHLESITWGLP